MMSLKELEDIIILISTFSGIIVIAFIIQLIANLVIIFSVRNNLKEINRKIPSIEQEIDNQELDNQEEEIDDSLKNNIIIKVSVIIATFCLILIILMTLFM